MVRKFIGNPFKLNIALLVIIFAVSVIVRLDNLRATMGRHHEYITAHVLCTDYRFYHEGASKFNFCPVMNFDSEAERKCSKYHLLKDKDNNFYYYSYPPFAFIFPHVIFFSLRQEPSVIGIRMIGLGIHFICSFLVYLIVLRIFNKKMKEHIFLPALLSYIVYLFSSGNLWFHANVYFSDVLVQPFILAMCFMLLRFFNTDEKIRSSFYIGFFVLTFLAVYTEYLALFFLFFTCVFLFVRFFSKKQWRFFLLIGVITLATSLSIGLTVYQFSSLSSFERFKHALTEKYSERSGHNENVTSATIKNSMSYDVLSEHYESNYGFLLDYAWYALLIILAVVLFKRDLAKQYLKTNMVFVFCISLMAYLGHMFALFNFNVVHDFGTLKSTIFLVPLVGSATHLLFEWIEHSAFLKKLYYIFISASLILFIHFSLNHYYILNDSSLKAEFVPELASLVAKYGSPETALGSNVYFTYETNYYCKRRVEAMPGLWDMQQMLKFCDIKEGIFFHRHWENYEVIKINQNGDTLLFKKESFRK